MHRFRVCAMSSFYAALMRRSGDGNRLKHTGVSVETQAIPILQEYGLYFLPVFFQLRLTK